jgi:hypothetical protein
MTEAYDGRQVVGMDLHRRRSVLVRMIMDGRKLETVRIQNSPAALRAVIARDSPAPASIPHTVRRPAWARNPQARPQNVRKEGGGKQRAERGKQHHQRGGTLWRGIREHRREPVSSAWRAWLPRSSGIWLLAG